VRYAKQVAAASIAYTYGEPVVFYKYMYDCAQAGRAAGLRSVMISNGYINTKPLAALCGVLDAVKIDFKAYTDKFYKQTCLGTLKPVLDAMVTVKEHKVWLELVYLVVPTLNDNASDIRAMAKWIVKTLGADTPIHFSRFQPQYKLKNLPPTPLDTLDRVYDICRDQGLHYVYIGNVPGHRAESTQCPKCGKTVIARYGYLVTSNDIKNGKCRFCGKAIAGVWA
jgi:pyruvate formate lyase activating enzyme